MNSGSVQFVPAGKRPKSKKQKRLKEQHANIKNWFKTRQVKGIYFILASALVVSLLLGLHDYFGRFVYVVTLNDTEVGIVKEAKDLDRFVDELTLRCADLYGMSMIPDTNIVVAREYRPDSISTPERVEMLIRQQMNFLTDAYMLTVNGNPLVALREENDFEELLVSLKAAYSRSGYGVKTLDTSISDELSIEPCSVSPEQIYDPEEIVEMITLNNGVEQKPAVYASSAFSRGNLDSRSWLSQDLAAVDQALAYLSPIELALNEEDLPPLNGEGIQVQTLEEVTVTEPVPFEIEIVEDEEMWIVQKEVLVEGREGEKELIYHVARENGQEVSRVKVSERIVEQPVTQVESWGTAQVPSVGTGQFIWPVEEGGGVTPGRGFSTWHTGIDIHGSMGSNILAADSGVVWFSGYGGTQGNYLIIYHGSYWSLYLHNETNLVNEGQVVEQGDVIARLGSTGRSTGPHLHFEIRLDDGSGEWLTYYQHKPIDPLQFFRP